MTRIAGFLLVLLVGACSPWHDIPDDLAYKGMELGSGPYPKSNRWETVDIALSTNFNYMNYLMKTNTFLISTVYFCDKEDSRVEGLGGLGIFRNPQHWAGMDFPENGPDWPPPPYTYHTFIHTFGHVTHPSFEKDKDTAILDFDLRQEPRDLCLRIIGMYSDPQSNVVRIPKEELIRLFATAPRTLGN